MGARQPDVETRFTVTGFHIHMPAVRLHELRETIGRILGMLRHPKLAAAAE